MNKRCEHCGESFKSSEYGDTYCSWDCAAAMPVNEEFEEFEEA